jgi:hypothetical protein
MSALAERLEDAEPGETVTFSGRTPCGKVQGVRGRPDAWIRLEGEDESAVIIPEPGYSAAALRLEDCEYVKFGRFAVEGMDETHHEVDRCVQVFRSDHIHGYDLVTSGVDEDHIHVAGCNHVLVQRVSGHGRGGEPMGGGKAGHLLYFTRVDGGGDCEDLVAEDLDCTDILGAAFQANGDGRRLSGVVFRRCRAVNYGAVGGSGVNLAQCDDPVLEDITLVSHPANDNPGVASYDGTTGTTLNRFDFEVNDLNWSGPMDATPGTPGLPVPPGGTAPTTPEPPEPEPEPGEEEDPCPTCGATGLVLAPEQPPGASEPLTIACPTCGGSGRVPG